MVNVGVNVGVLVGPGVPVGDAVTDAVGVVHAVADCSTMKDLTFAIADSEKKKIFLPNIPSFVLRLLFGEMGQLLTKSLRVSNDNLLKTFHPSYNQLSLLKL